MIIINTKYFDIAMEEAKIGYNLNEIPIGCVIVKNDTILAKAHNLKASTNDVTAHAEIIAIKEASKILNDWRLNDCILYSTMKPCIMCMGAIMESRISKVFYIVDNKYEKNYYNKLDIENVLYKYDENLKKLRNFFESKR